MSGSNIDMLRKLANRLQLDGILISDLANVRYFSGFTGEGFLLITKDKKIILTDSRYDIQARSQAKSFVVVLLKDQVQDLTTYLKKLGLDTFGFESEYVSYAFYRQIKAKLRSVKLHPITNEIDHLRLHKSPEEVKEIREAIAIASEAFQVALADLTKGRKEYEFAAQLEFECRRRGAERMAFDTIVASGPRSALPHGTASPKKIRSGELVTIDWGIVFHGYHSDETQTIACGKTTAKQRDIYYIVKEAHDSTIEAIQPGMTFKEVDALARDYIQAKGMGKYFGHGLGHGVGLKVHEDPRISWQSEGVIEEGMIFTVEPGIYIPEWGGVRIESMILVRKNSPEILTILHKGLRVIG